MIIHLDDKNFKKEVVEEKLPVVVDFSATWCGPCQMFAPIFEEGAKDFKNKVKFAKLDVDKGELTSTEFKVQGVPTIILFKKGKIIARTSGAMEKKELIKWVKENLKC